MTDSDKLEKIKQYVQNYKVPSHGYPWHNKLKEILELWDYVNGVITLGLKLKETMTITQDVKDYGSANVNADSNTILQSRIMNIM